VRPPVFLRRRPDEPADDARAAWYRSLVAQVVRPGEWRLLDVTGWPDNQSCRNLLAWEWGDPAATDRYLTVVNLSDHDSQGQVRLSWPNLSGARVCRLTDVLQDVEMERDPAQLAGPGLFVSLGPWQFHYLRGRAG
jgi:hypothetical protein